MNPSIARLGNLEPFRDLDEALIYEFFAVFSRFEYALKMNNRYLLKSRWEREGERGPDANWNQFAKDTEAQYEQQVTGGGQDFIEAATYIVDNYPKLEVVREKQDKHGNTSQYLDFAPIKSNKDTEWERVIEYLKRIRNNLFHGGKYRSGPNIDPSRDEMLLRYGLVILRACVTWNKDVNLSFMDRT